MSKSAFDVFFANPAIYSVMMKSNEWYPMGANGYKRYTVQKREKDTILFTQESDVEAATGCKGVRYSKYVAQGVVRRGDKNKIYLEMYHEGRPKSLYEATETPNANELEFVRVPIREGERVKGSKLLYQIKDKIIQVIMTKDNDLVSISTQVA